MENAFKASANALATRAERMAAGAGVAVMSIGALLVWYLDPANTGYLPSCPLRRTTGIACPGCGLTRGFHALFHGDFASALDFNALIPIFIIIFGYFYLSMLLVFVRGRAFPRWSLSLPMIWGFLVVLIVFGILRNLPFYPFNVLYP
ncbi:MAG TPA: DUF2752 domain-containing protein [Blastocatellia bacterium]|nr:DUF2752 domain-containing protein [Blastocatellia bacterium]